MKIVIWAVTGLLLVLWTGCVALATAAINWLAGSGDLPARGAQAMGQWPVPEWLTLMIPPAALEPMKVGITGLIDGLVTAVAWMGPVLGWLSPVLWVVWGMVALLLLAVATAAHVFWARTHRSV